MRSPSFHAVGLMVPGLPIIGLGRNPGVAWGGTNLRAASSDLFDVSRLPPGPSRKRDDHPAALWFGARRKVRTTPLGPVVTDAPPVPSRDGEALALRWAGHEPTDEITALLRAGPRPDAAGFRDSFANFGVSPQNMLYADRAGAIGRVTAAVLPDRAGFPQDGPVLDGSDPAATAPWAGCATRATCRGWRTRRTACSPRPTRTRHLGRDPPPDRLVLQRRRPGGAAARAAAGQAEADAGGHDRVAEGHARAQGRRLAAGLLARFDALPGGAPEPAMLARLRGWDGDYAEGSEAALVFELLLGKLVPALLPEGRSGGGRGAESGWNFLTDLPAPRPRRPAAGAARGGAARRRGGGGADRRPAPDWGEVHRLRAAHWLVNAPVVGAASCSATTPWAGRARRR
jgi:penicillin amidase